MVSYAAGLIEYFPWDVISPKSQYIQVTAEVPESASNNESTRDHGQDSTETTCVCKCNKCQQTLSELYIKYDSLERSLKQLREHLMNIKKAYGDEISQLKQYENATQGHNGLTDAKHYREQHSKTSGKHSPAVA